MRDAIWIFGALFFAVLVWTPWGSLFDWAKEEIKSKPKRHVL
jgi:hypothetical protein